MRRARLVFEADDLGKQFGDRVVVRSFSTRVMRGDRVGLIGPNGAGKTTLFRLLLGDLPPDTGTVRTGTNVKSRTTINCASNSIPSARCSTRSATATTP